MAKSRRRSANSTASGPPPAVGSGSVRIIGGRLRGSRLPVPNRPGLRPSSDRVRETLFNWLQHDLAGLRVADLFAGSGCLALESLSRGAAYALAVERDAELAAQLRAQAQRLGVADRLDVRCADAGALLPLTDQQVDLVFLDPPFQADSWQSALQAAERWAKPVAWIYLESPRDLPLDLPPSWRLYRQGQTRDVRFALYRRVAEVAGGAQLGPLP